MSITTQVIVLFGVVLVGEHCAHKQLEHGVAYVGEHQGIQPLGRSCAPLCFPAAQRAEGLQI